MSTPEKWQALLRHDVQQRLAQDEGEGEAEAEVMNGLMREFESAVINAALKHTQGRRQEAAEARDADK